MRHSSDVAQANALFDDGRFGDALAMIETALGSAPDDPDLLFARASTLFAWGRSREARPVFLKAERAGLGTSKLYLRSAWCCLWSGFAQEAEGYMRKAVAVDPEDWETHYGLGTVLQGQQKVPEAIESFERALALSPDNPYCLASLVNGQLDRVSGSRGEMLARHAVDAHPDSATAWTNLAITLIFKERFAEALEAFERAQKLERELGLESDEHLNVAICLRDIGRTEEAIGLYEARLPLRPSLGAHGHYAVALLTAGRLVEGWSQYEFRWTQDPLLSLRPPFRKPVWSGQDLHGRTILLRSEQGVGDVIQFIRYAPLLKAMGAKVVLQLRKGTDELARGFRGVDTIVEPNSAYPAFDFYIHPMSLPRVFGSDLDTIPGQVPYIDVEPGRVERLRPCIGSDDALKVGLVWAGDPAHLRDRQRSISLAQLAPLASVPGLRFFSLQKGPAAAQINSANGGLALTDLGPELRDFADTAAAISLLDLVVCVDTSVAHLAGALGKPVWVLLPVPADWRWMEGRQDSPWYPTMRLFRQGSAGDWPDVVGRVKASLAQWATRPRAADHRRPASQEAKAAVAPEPARASSPRAIDRPALRVPGLCEVAETRVGLVQFVPEQPVAGESIPWYGEYVQPQLDLLGRLVRPGAVVVETGAGVGTHALFMSEAVGPDGHLLVYESRELFKYILRQNLAINRVGNVTVMTRSLARGDAGVDAGNAKPQALPSGAKDPFAQPETVDDLRLERLDLLKIDEPSQALDVVAGADATLWKLRPLVFAAVADEAALAMLADRLRDFGYRRWRMETPLFNPDNFNLRDRDIFSDRTALAVLAVPEEIELGIALDACREID
ncbi:MAG: tetratricopeptide repeat protein [Betaproteobacteria bacterium]|nr:tetratricopeptide repeat protein [Betaproteobacteria bacterium]